ncbi:hypothetical protein [Bradyrhizobium sp. Ash2021]|uniref:hypothetical protein n=1 Tax=Bradyrhizobium sp. Ash2021 TaxID=2954771 RepID=UPI002815275C|nr:hypothetical protein [Bradyrhizobium sp. Ash2021]WMT70934.1 hypothetical protein NL528_22705 [Bradyrhizobium sp. Ash2021]
MVGKLSRALRRVPTHFVDIKENPRWLPMFALGRIMFFRNLTWSATKASGTFDSTSSLFPNIGTDEVVEALRNKGLFRGLHLPGAVTDEILSFAESTQCFGNFDRKIEFLAADHASIEAAIGRGVLTGHFFERVLNCDAAIRVQKDPLLKHVAQSYLGDQAHVTATRLWWSFPASGTTEADLHLASQERFHFDLDDWRLIKFFFYIQPVDENSGPHFYVIGSHSRRALRHQYTLLVGHDASDVEAVYGKASIVKLTGPAGFGFVEDPFGFHMGSLVKSHPRLVLEIAFGVSRNLHRRFFGEPHPKTIAAP